MCRNLIVVVAMLVPLLNGCEGNQVAGIASHPFGSTTFSGVWRSECIDALGEEYVPDLPELFYVDTYEIEGNSLSISMVFSDDSACSSGNYGEARRTGTVEFGESVVAVDGTPALKVIISTEEEPGGPDFEVGFLMPDVLGIKNSTLYIGYQREDINPYYELVLDTPYYKVDR